MKQLRRSLALLLALTLCMNLSGQLTAAAEEYCEEAAVSAADAEEETVLSVGDAGFWDEFRPEYAEDGEYIKEYDRHQQQKSELTTQSVTNGTTAPYISQLYDHSQKKDCTIEYGIDVSYFNPTVDWAKVKAAGIKYAIIRCGRTAYGCNSGFNILGEDPKFKAHLEGAYAAGLAVGVYYFSQANTEDEARQEAEHVIKVLKPYKSKITLPVFCDRERVGGGAVCRVEKVSQSVGTKCIKRFNSILEAEGYQTGVYGNSTDLVTLCDYTQLTAYPLWYAHYSDKPEFSGNYDIWQYTRNGRVDGVTENGRLQDVDVSFHYIKKPIDTAPTPPLAMTPTPTLPSDTEQEKEPEKEPVQEPEKEPEQEPEKEPEQETQPVIQPEKPVIVKPKAPKGLKMTANTTTSITVSWTADANCDSYQVYGSNQKDKSYKLLGTVKKNSFTAKKLKTNYGYYFKVRGVNSAGNGADSSVLSAYTAQGTPRLLYTTGNLNLRQGAGTEYPVLLTIPKYTLLDVGREYQGSNGKSWYYVKYKKNGKTYKGYLSAAYVKVGSRAKTTKKTQLRKSAKPSAKNQKTISKSKKVLVFSTKKGSDKKTWYKTQYVAGGKLYTGYLPSSAVKMY